MSLSRDDLAELEALLGPGGVLSSDAARFTYENDALTLERGDAEVVVLPRHTDEVAAIVRWAVARGLPVTPRGAGTGLAGGATPEHGGVVLSVNRMDRLIRLDPERRLAWVQPGLVNLELSRAAAPHGLHFAPDPSSQQVSTLGGNVSTNAGGPHCLQHGVTFNHVLAATVVLADGDVITLGGEAPDAPGIDLLSVVCGSEGTLGIVTEMCLRLTPVAEAVRTMLFDFERLPDACRAVSAVIAAGIVPGAMEIMDRHTVTLVEAWLQIGLPTDAGGVLLIEIDGPAVTLEERVARVATLARAHGARTTRVARDEAERQAIWKGRKSAFGAYGRAASGFYIMDGVVPRTRLAEALERIERLCEAEGLEAGNVFHAGDGNLHPHVLFDASRPDRRDAALGVSHAILRMCIAMGGTISGEHGVGIEKRSMMNELFAPEDLAAMERLRDAFDPARRLNPGKILPSGAGCGETRAAQRSFGGIPVTVPASGEGPWI